MGRLGLGYLCDGRAGRAIRTVARGRVGYAVGFTGMTVAHSEEVGYAGLTRQGGWA